MVRPTDVARYWIDDVGPAGWYKQEDALDQVIRDKFLETWQAISQASCEGLAMEEWLESPEATLGLLILLDQLPRTMFRGDTRSFATDAKARSVSKKAIDKGWDMRIPVPERQFFYMPLMHSECLADQDRCVRLMATRMGEDDGNLIHAKAHREIIRKFGRFPYRNDALDRKSTAAEEDFIANGGYRAIMKDLAEPESV